MYCICKLKLNWFLCKLVLHDSNLKSTCNCNRFRTWKSKSIRIKMSRVHSTVITISHTIFVAGKTLESLKFLTPTNLLRYSWKQENARTDEQIVKLCFCALITKHIAYALTNMSCAFCVDWILSVVFCENYQYRYEKIYVLVQGVSYFALLHDLIWEDTSDSFTETGFSPWLCWLSDLITWMLQL